MKNNLKYSSKYSPNKQITQAQYIIELVCEHKASFDKTNLPIKFWELPQWGNFFKRNLRQVHKLLKQFDGNAIIRALNLPSFSNSYSIFTDRFIELVQQEHDKIDKESKAKMPNVTINRETVKGQSRNTQTKSNILSKLRELE